MIGLSRLRKRSLGIAAGVLFGTAGPALGQPPLGQLPEMPLAPLPPAPLAPTTPPMPLAPAPLAVPVAPVLAPAPAALPVWQPATPMPATPPGSIAQLPPGMVPSGLPGTQPAAELHRLTGTGPSGTSDVHYNPNPPTVPDYTQIGVPLPNASLASGATQAMIRRLQTGGTPEVYQLFPHWRVGWDKGFVIAPVDSEKTPFEKPVQQDLGRLPVAQEQPGAAGLQRLCRGAIGLHRPLAVGTRLLSEPAMLVTRSLFPDRDVCAIPPPIIEV